MIKERRITLGCDPEYEMFSWNSGRIVEAREYLEEDIWTSYGSIGIDGAGRQIEFRPNPSTSVEEVLSNMMGLHREFREHFPNHGLLTVGHKFPLGGHIHFCPDNPKISSSETVWNFIIILDNFVGRYFLRFSGNARGSYRRLGAYELGKSHGGFEYRSFPAVVFSHPKLLEVLLLICKRLAELYFCEQNKMFIDTFGSNDFPNGVNKRRMKELLPAELVDKLFLWKKYIRRLCLGSIPTEANWLGEEVHPVMSRDDWDKEVQQWFRTAINRNFPSVFCYFFGFHRDRGEVYNFSVEGGSSVASVRCGGEPAFGLSYEFRNNKEHFLRMLPKVIDGMRRYFETGRRW